MGDISRRTAIAGLAGLSACAGSRAAPATVRPAPFSTANRIALPPALGQAFSADGRRLLIGAGADGALDVFAQPVAQGEPTRLTQQPNHATPLSYFPADERILLALGMGDGRVHIGVLGPDGAIEDLTPGLAREAQFLGWRGDGGGFFFTAGAAATMTAYEVDASTLQRRPLYETRGVIEALSRDGRWLAFANGGDLSVLDLSAPTQTPRLAASGDPRVFEFAPDSRSLVCASRRGAFVEAWRYDLASGAETPMMQAQADVLSVVSSPSGRYRVFSTGVEAPTDVIIVDQQVDQPLPLPGGVRDVRFNRDETRIAYRRADDPWPQDIFVSDLDGGRIARLVHAPAAR